MRTKRGSKRVIKSVLFLSLASIVCIFFVNLAEAAEIQHYTIPPLAKGTAPIEVEIKVKTDWLDAQGEPWTGPEAGDRHKDFEIKSKGQDISGKTTKQTKVNTELATSFDKVIVPDDFPPNPNPPPGPAPAPNVWTKPQLNLPAQTEPETIEVISAMTVQWKYTDENGEVHVVPISEADFTKPGEIIGTQGQLQNEDRPPDYNMVITVDGEDRDQVTPESLQYYMNLLNEGGIPGFNPADYTSAEIETIAHEAAALEKACEDFQNNGETFFGGQTDLSGQAEILTLPDGSQVILAYNPLTGQIQPIGSDLDITEPSDFFWGDNTRPENNLEYYEGYAELVVPETTSNLLPQILSSANYNPVSSEPNAGGAASSYYIIVGSGSTSSSSNNGGGSFFSSFFSNSVSPSSTANSTTITGFSPKLNIPHF